jgi:F420-0:gamma-glutamyl ligase-like protein
MAEKKQKSPTIVVDGITYLRIPVKTHIIAPGEKPEEFIAKYTKDILKPGDIIFISEKVVAITQGRAVPVDKIKVGLLAKMMWRGVRKVSYGTGLRSPYSMQCAIDEAGHLRIIAAGIIGVLGKLVGRRGDFYRVAGMQAATIDAAYTTPVEPYHNCVIKGPKDPDKVAENIKSKTGAEATVVDVNDIGGSWVLGHSSGVNKELVQKILKDNPLGQSDELTPFGIIRKA